MRRSRRLRAVVLARRLAFPRSRAMLALMATCVLYDAAILHAALASSEHSSSSLSLLYALYLLYRGEPERALSLHSPPVVPFRWLMGQALFFAVAACALRQAGGGADRQRLLRVGSSGAWWGAVCLATLLLAVARIALSLAICACFSASSWIGAQAEAGTVVSQVDARACAAGVSSQALFAHTALCILLPHILLAQLLALLSLYMKPFWSFACVAAISAASAVVPGPFPFGDWSMLARNALYDPGGLSPYALEALSIVLCASCAAIGFARINARPEFL